MKAIVGIIVIVIMLVSMMPFLDTASKIEWTTYLGIPLIIFTGLLEQPLLLSDSRQL